MNQISTFDIISSSGVNGVPVQWPAVQLNPAASAAAGQQQFTTQQQSVMAAYPMQPNTSM